MLGIEDNSQAYDYDSDFFPNDKWDQLVVEAWWICTEVEYFYFTSCN